MLLLRLAAQRPSKRAATKKSTTEMEIDPATSGTSETEMQVDAVSGRSKRKAPIPPPAPALAASRPAEPSRISTSTLPESAGPTSNLAAPTRSKKGKGLAPPSAGAGRAR
jgi:hypothetical protein